MYFMVKIVQRIILAQFDTISGYIFGTRLNLLVENPIYQSDMAYVWKMKKYTGSHDTYDAETVHRVQIFAFE